MLGQLIKKLVENENLNEEESYSAIQEIMG
jgi:anthranilate phosphoribosyltransferase